MNEHTPTDANCPRCTELHEEEVSHIVLLGDADAVILAVACHTHVNEVDRGFVMSSKPNVDPRLPIRENPCSDCSTAIENGHAERVDLRGARPLVFACEDHLAELNGDVE